MVDGPAFTHHEREFDDYLAQPLLPHKLSQLGPGVAFGDADGDDQDELFCGGAAGQAGHCCIARRTAGSVFPGRGTRTLSAKTWACSGLITTAMAIKICS